MLIEIDLITLGYYNNPNSSAFFKASKELEASSFEIIFLR